MPSAAAAAVTAKKTCQTNYAFTINNHNPDSPS
jgi:hypothetical protein